MGFQGDANSTLKLDAGFSMRLPDSRMLAATSIALLERIDVSGSITQAAKDCDISYRTAWQNIEGLQNRSTEKLVERIAGGQHGGGSSLTPAGRRLVAMYRAAESEHRRFVEMLGEGLSDFEKYSKFMRRWFMKTSVRNQLHGTVQVVSTGAVNTEVVIGIGGEDRLTAMITNDGAEEMQMRLGKEVTALIKESSVLLCSSEHLPGLSTRNRLRGSVLRCHEGAVCSEVMVELPGSKVITAMISCDSMAAMNLSPGMPVWACFKASDVILAGQD